MCLAGLVWSCEVIVARLTFDRVTPFDLAVSAAALLVIAMLFFAAALQATENPVRRRVLTAIALHLPLIAVLGPLVGNAAKLRSEALGWMATLAVTATLLAWAVRRGRGSAALDPSNRFVLAAFVAAATVAAVVQAGLDAVRFDAAGVSLDATTTLPTPGVALGVVALWTLSAWLSSRLLTLPLAIGLTLAVALWPAQPMRFGSHTGEATAGAPDVVLISVDTLRADAAAEMASYRRLAQRGTTFANVQAPAPWTMPSMASLMTGLPAAGHKAVRFADGYISGLDAAAVTLAERLAAAGYATAAVLSPNMFVSRVYGFDRGFMVFDHATERSAFAMPRSALEPVARPFIPDLLSGMGFIGRRPFGDAADLAGRATALLRDRDDRPLFLWVHFLDCHIPYRHAHETDLPFRLRVAMGGGGLREHLRDRQTELVRSKTLGAREAWTCYRNELRHVDAAITEILDEMDARPRRSIVALVSDHGEEILDHGGFEHGHTLYQELLHVPLVIAGGDGRPPGAVEAVPAGLEDVMPTLLQAAGLPPAGRTLAPPVAQRRLVSWNLLYGLPVAYAVRDGDWKLLVSGWGRKELFNLASDPGETKDLSPSQAELVAQLDQPPNFDVGAHRPVELTPSQRNALRMLGYGEGK